MVIGNDRGHEWGVAEESHVRTEETKDGLFEGWRMRDATPENRRETKGREIEPEGDLSVGDLSATRNNGHILAFLNSVLPFERL